MIKLPLNQLSLYRKIRIFKDYYEQKNGYSPSINDIDINDSSDLERIKYLDGLPYNLKSLVHLSDNMDVFESRTNAIEDYINKNEVQYSVKKLLSCLQNRERKMIQMFYGINRKEETLAFIGDYFGLTRERVRQIKEKTVRHLRDILHNRQDEK
jgi:RNA polymerase primary sigma factor